MISTLRAIPGDASFGRWAVARFLFLAAAGLPCTTAAANDSAAELATGGLVLTGSADIEMRAEDLYVSPRQVRVGYRFYNASPADVTTLVAFPMPDITVADATTNVPLPTDDPHNLLGFSTSVDGTPVKARVVQKVFAAGVDRTADLERLKVPLAPHLRSTDKALNRVPQSRWNELAGLGLAGIEEYAAGAGMRKQLSPRWTLKTTYYWEQTFPAGKGITIEHRYKPSVGKSFHTSLADPAAIDQPWLKDYMRKYCIDREFMASVDRASRAAGTPHAAPFSEVRISYLLTTGANWARPIGDFRLVVDKANPSSLVSFCGEGAKQISPTRYEVRKTDFLPTGDLHVLILEPIKHR